MAIKFLASGQEKGQSLEQIGKKNSNKKGMSGLLIGGFWVLGGFFGCPLFPLPGREAANVVADCEGSPVYFSIRYSGEQQ